MARVYRRLITYALLSIFSLLLLVFLIHSFPPTYTFSFEQISISIIPIFFFLLFLTIFGIGTFVTRSKLQGILFAGTIICYLLLRILGITHIFFLALLVVLFVVLEMFLLKAK